MDERRIVDGYGISEDEQDRITTDFNAYVGAGTTPQRKPKARSKCARSEEFAATLTLQARGRERRPPA